MVKQRDLVGAVVLITGSEGGIGTALRGAFSGRGAIVVGADLPGRGGDLDIDVTDVDTVHHVVAEVLRRHGRLDVVVANAGVGHAGTMEDLDDDAWSHSIDVNLWGTVHVVRAAYSVMRARNHGSIVLVASLSGVVPTPLLVPYATSKHAVVGLATSLAPEAARHGVGVTVVCPGTVETPLLDAVAATGGMSVRRYLTAAAGAPLPPSKLAERVVVAVEEGHLLVVPGRAGLLHRCQRFAPWLVARLQRHGVERELRAAAPLPLD
jgi:NAD(P)-dependent dehydrogenase (short-subunit alcohol dehydrogenase family)